MENSLSNNHFPSLDRDQKLHTFQNQNMYKQTFVCRCQKSFESMQQYKLHNANEHHDNYSSIQKDPEPVGDQFFSHKSYPACQQGFGLNTQFQPVNNFANNSSQLWSRNLNYNEGPRQPVNRMKYKYSNLNQTYDPVLTPNQNEFDHKQRRSQTIQQKQSNLKYIQNYYRQKMTPFYRQFDIQPFKEGGGQKSRRQTYYQKVLQLRNKMKQGDHQVSTSLQDFSVIEQQLYSRMLPLSSGIAEFVDNFQGQNQQVVNSLNIQQKQMISKVLQEKLYHLNQLNNLNSIRNNYYQFNHFDQNDFMSSDLLMALGSFMNFVSKILKPSKVWLIELMMIVVVNTLIDYEKDQNNNLYKYTNLIVSNIFQFFTKIKLNAQNQTLPINIPSLCINRLLSWFCQWSSMKQYMFNKFNVDYLDNILNQINQINTIYQENVQKYQECARKRKIDFARKLKHKLIQKRKDRQKIKKEKEKYNNQIIERQIPLNNFKNGNELNQQEIKKSNIIITNQLSTTKNQHILPENSKNQGDFHRNYFKKAQNQYFNNHSELKDGVSLQKKMALKQEKRELNQANKDFKAQVINSNEKNFSNSKKINNKFLNSQSNDGIPKFGQNPNSHISRSEEQQIQEEQQGQIKYQMNDQYPYFPVYQSQYISYFSPQCIQNRKKEKQIWKAKLQKYKLVVENPETFKSKIKQEILNQLQKIQEILKYQHNQSGQSNLLFNKQNGYDFYKQRKMQLSQHNHNFGVYGRQKNEQQNTQQKINKSLCDPFIIVKNFRKLFFKPNLEKRSSSEYKLMNCDFMKKDKSENQNKSYLNSNQNDSIVEL